MCAHANDIKSTYIFFSVNVDIYLVFTIVGVDHIVWPLATKQG